MTDETEFGTVLELIHTRMHEEPLVLLQGPRTVGKTHLLNELAAGLETSIIDLDNCHLPPSWDHPRCQ